MPYDINRVPETQVVTMATNLSEVIDFRRYTMMTVSMPAEWTTADIGFQVCDTPDGTFLPLYKDDATLLIIDGPTANKAFVAPAELAAAHYVKLWSNTDGSDENQGAARTLRVMLKG